MFLNRSFIFAAFVSLLVFDKLQFGECVPKPGERSAPGEPDEGSAPGESGEEPAPSEKHKGCPQKISTLIREIGDDEQFHLDGGAAFTPGAVIVFDENELSTEEDGVIGTSQGVCNYLQSMLFCTWNMVITNEDFGVGSIAIQGKYENMVAVGGSGCYEGATGSVKGEAITSDEVELFEYKVDIKMY